MLSKLFTLLSSPTGIVAGLGSIAGIVAAGYGIFRFITWKVTPSQDQKDQKIDSSAKTEQKQAEESGRPV